MQELELKTYNFSVQAIGFIKSLEKEMPQLVNEELRKASGNVSLKFMDALESIENEDFAENIRQSYTNAKQSFELLKVLDCSANKEMEKQKSQLLTTLHEINEELHQIIKKLIF